MPRMALMTQMERSSTRLYVPIRVIRAIRGITVANTTGSCVVEKRSGVEFRRNDQKLETCITPLDRTGPRQSMSKIDSILTVNCHFAAERWAGINLSR